MSARVRVYIACSLDGFIAGPGDDLSWLPHPDPDSGEDHGFGAFMDEVGALLMGRSTLDVVAGFGGAWPYGDKPVLVATHRELAPPVATVRAVSGGIEAIVAEARAAAGGKDVWVDGGALVRQVLDAGLVDHLVVTMVPVVLGAGSPLFAGCTRRHALTLEQAVPLPGGLVQLFLAPNR
jgi:dihydrofolate reductase